MNKHIWFQEPPLTLTFGRAYPSTGLSCYKPGVHSTQSDVHSWNRICVECVSTWYWPAHALQLPKLLLTYRDKVADILHKTFSLAFSWLKIFVTWLTFHWKVYNNNKTTLVQSMAWRRTSHDLNQWWYSFLWRNSLHTLSYFIYIQNITKIITGRLLGN